jgi:(p)ppGpp synthase/HD superfamily hydrolase
MAKRTDKSKASKGGASQNAAAAEMEPVDNGSISPETTAPKGGRKKKGGDSVAVMFEGALALALEAHRGQTDKYNQPYIMHVLGVMGRVRTIEEKIVALLHDVVEDTDHTFDDLRALGISERVITAVDCLTRRRGESYDHFVDRIAPNPLARAVKLADLEDNMDVRRASRTMKDKDAERMEKYRKAWQKLAAMHAGEE